MSTKKTEETADVQPVVEGQLHKSDFLRVIEDMKATRPELYETQKEDLQKQMDNAPE